MSTYKNYNDLTDLGIKLFVGSRVYTKGVLITDDNFFNFLFTQIQPNKNIILCGYFQTNEFALYLHEYFREDIQQTGIIQNNIFKYRYKSNNDAFVHIKLTDMMLVHDPYKYYDLVLSTIKFENGYISCDNINNPLCQQLMNKYNLKHIKYNMVETIMFATTCNSIILSKGTFSWLIGMLSFYSTVYFPKSTDLLIFINLILSFSDSISL